MALLSANHPLKFHLLQGGTSLTKLDDSPGTEDKKDTAPATQDGPQSTSDIVDDKEYQGEGAHLSKKDVDPKEIERDSSAQRREHSVGSVRNDSPTDRFIEKGRGPSRRFVARERYIFHNDEGASQKCANHEEAA